MLIRIETQAGHGAGKPTAKIIEEAADELGFLFHALRGGGTRGAEGGGEVEPLLPGGALARTTDRRIGRASALRRPALSC